MVQEIPEVDGWLASALAALPGAVTVPYPDWGSQTFQVGGKHFGRLGTLPDGRLAVTLKGDPEENAALREQYAAVTPGHYANKRLWISIALDGDCPRAVVLESLASAYGIVRSSLTKRAQAELE